MWRSSSWSPGWHTDCLLGIRYAKNNMFHIVNRMCEEILSLLNTVVLLPTLAQCTYVGHGFQHLANSPAFSHSVGARDGRHCVGAWDEFSDGPQRDRNVSLCSLSSASLASSLAARSLSKAQTSLLFCLLVGVLEEVEGISSSSLSVHGRMDTLEGAEASATALLWLKPSH